MFRTVFLGPVDKLVLEQARLSRPERVGRRNTPVGTG